MVVLQPLLLSGVMEGCSAAVDLGDTDRARHWYERFLTDWKDADPGIPELIEAKKRQAALGESRTTAVQ